MLINSNFSSANYSVEENRKIEYIIVHFTEIPFDLALERLTNKSSQVSSHYLIKEDGELFQLVSDKNIAWHAGKSSWNGEEGLNKNSIGIELDNSGKSKFSDAQMKTCLSLSKELKARYAISKHNFIGHSDVAPDRKIDPGIFFDWSFFASNGLGNWHFIDKLSSPKTLFCFNQENYKIKTLQRNLQNIGYKIDITGIFDVQTNFVIRAFQSKFYPKIILNKGIEFYQNNKSQYHWDSSSQIILEKLLSKILA